MEGDPVFKACTRNPTVWGVSLLPFLAVQGCILLFSVYAGLLWVVLSIPATLLMKWLSGDDDRYFESLLMRTSARLKFPINGPRGQRTRCVAGFTEPARRGTNVR